VTVEGLLQVFGPLGGGDHLPREREELVEVVRPPDGHEASVQGPRERRGVVQSPREVDRIEAEGRPWSGASETREQPRSQDAAVLADRGQRLLEQRQDAGVVRGQRHVAPAKAERGASQLLGHAGAARDVGRPDERVLRRDHVALGRLGCTQSEQELAADQGVRAGL
jgi:hypothetical protein